MKRQHISPLLLGLALIPYGIVFASNFIQEKTLWSLKYFTESLQHLFLVTVLLIFLGTIWSGSFGPSKTIASPLALSYSWGTGFVLLIALSLGLNLYADPHALFGGHRFPSTTAGARLAKTELYGRSDAGPDIVILGSSRAFTLSPEYIEKKMGYRVFNMSVDRGRVADFTVQLNFMLDSGSIPRVLVLEIGQDTFYDDYLNSNLQPRSLFPYMSANMFVPVANDILREALAVQSLSDSAYLLTAPDLEDRLRTWTFEADGMGVRRPLTHNQYLALLSDSIERKLPTLLCPSPQSTAKQMLQDAIELAEVNKIAVLLYQSPLHPLLIKTAFDKNPAAFEACHKMTAEYLSSLLDAHPNVFYLDLSEYEEVASLEEEGFYDAFHLRPGASELVVDALTPELEAAMLWALQESKK